MTNHLVQYAQENHNGWSRIRALNLYEDVLDQSTANDFPAALAVFPGYVCDYAFERTSPVNYSAAINEILGSVYEISLQNEGWNYC